MTTNALTKDVLALEVSGVSVEIASMRRSGTLAPLVFLHGFGSTKEDYADVAHRPRLAGRPILAYDAPGCGQSRCADLSHLSIPFLVETALAVLDCARIERFHLIGHSMGGLTALELAHAQPERVLSFTDIEGNVAPEDCFLSRQIVTHRHERDDAFLPAFAERAWNSPARASQFYAASVEHKVRPGAVRGIFESMVDLSDNGELMAKFLGLPFPRMFMYGDENRSLSYLPLLKERGLRLSEIPACGHWPMYTDPVTMWNEIEDFISSAER